MGAWSQSVSKLLQAPSTDKNPTIAPYTGGPGGVAPKNLLTSPGNFQPQNQAFSDQLYGRKSGQEQQLFMGDILAQLGIGSLGAGSQVMQQPLNYYSGILGGDRQSMMETVAPEVNTILGQYDTAKRAVAENAPRGGGANTTQANAPYALSGEITNLLNTVRPQAAAATTDIGKFLSTLGTTETGQAGNLINQNAWTQLGKGQQQAGMAGALGKAIGSILAGAGVPGLIGGLLNQKPSTAPAQLPISGTGPSMSTVAASSPSFGAAAAPAAASTLPGAASLPGFASAPAGAASSSLGGFEAISNLADPFAGSALGTGSATTGGLAPEVGLLGTDIPTGSMFAPEGAYGSFAGVGGEGGAGGATGGTGATSGGSGGFLGGGAAATAGGLALGAGLPLAVLQLLGIGPSQIFGGVPTKGTQENINKTEAPVLQALLGQMVSRGTTVESLNQQYQYARKFAEDFAKSRTGGYSDPMIQQYLQQLQAAYQQQLQKLQGEQR